jgi:hypothetical protein
MVKPALVAGLALTVIGLAAGCWPNTSNALERSRRLVPKRTYDRRGPVVTVHVGAERVRDAGGNALSVPMLLGADGYWVRARPGYLTRAGLTGTRVLVLDRAMDAVGDARTTTFLTRWLQEGGAVLMLTKGQGPEARRDVGAGRVAVIDPAAFDTTDFVDRLLDAMHWLDGASADK